MQEDRGFPEEEILDALAVAGLVGNVIRTNASISGAECGCQAEIGSACSMAAAAVAQLYGLSIDQIEYAAEIAMEHNLGLTCDPVNGLVQIPCIERNAVAAMRALSSVNLSRFLYATRKISFDDPCLTTTPQGVSLVKLIEPPCTERYARWCERTGKHQFPLLLDCFSKSISALQASNPLILSSSSDSCRRIRRSPLLRSRSKISLILLMR